MKPAPISEGDLFAYLAGEALPNIEQILDAFPELQQELNEFRQLEHWLQRNFGGIERPNPQDLVDVATGQATATQQLIVAAYVRKSERGRRELELLKKKFGILEKTPIPKIRLPVFIAMPLFGGIGLKSPNASPLPSIFPILHSRLNQEVEQTFQVTELQIQVTLRIPPRAGEHWQISGLVTQHQQAVADAKVTLRANHSRPRPRTTDEMGFFIFRHLSEGTYRLRIYLDQAVIRVPDIELVDHA